MEYFYIFTAVAIGLFLTDYILTRLRRKEIIRCRNEYNSSIKEYNDIYHPKTKESSIYDEEITITSSAEDFSGLKKEE